ncbi:MAG: hypothetical protein GY696_37035 [Gammaproteobacteria bacterium]|nr:hypothetical protein [Gammaproteobacteria bacterium]
MYNAAAGLPWLNKNGDWIDNEGTPQGNIPFATFTAKKPSFINTDVTKLVISLHKGHYPNRGLLIRLGNGNGTIKFHSREQINPDSSPTLIIKTDKSEYSIVATADTNLDPSTVRTLGGLTKLTLSKNRNILLYFPLESIPSSEQVRIATLRLNMIKLYGNRPVNADIYLCQPGGLSIAQEIQYGIASNYPYDEGLDSDPNTILTTNFSEWRWKSKWSETQGNLDVYSSNKDFIPLDGDALRIRFKKGSKLAANISYKFTEKLGLEPESIYFRYYLWLSDNWNPKVGGKFPGIAGTYGKAGWGGRRSDGFNGWSTRGSYKLPLPHDNPLSGLTPIGTYAYVADMPSKYGANWPWPIEQLGLLEKEKWYSIEQYIKLNTPGEHNGTLKSWVNGQLAFDKRDIIFRKSLDIKIDRIWINFYHGGTSNIPTDQDVYIDNIVISNKYIGPMIK